eukprot:CAMPEP_0185762042 /NCGR_PEP_ID=MMETSP1174-20130828/21001_1 /TAXON_ID=35687 /ORGANISM="Dictyocha speculum, Strain CCMP1381" /LENGTH=33 /DNA_ID= /DNA_START= /DNA_END= /DNA_ORIENTATION=
MSGFTRGEDCLALLGGVRWKLCGTGSAGEWNVT